MGLPDMGSIHCPCKLSGSSTIGDEGCMCHSVWEILRYGKKGHDVEGQTSSSLVWGAVTCHCVTGRKMITDKLPKHRC